jgi:excisionase family DNA binding protein
MVTDQQQLIWTVEEAAERLKLNRSAVYRAIGAGELRSFKWGRLRRVSEQAIREFIARQEGRASGLTSPPAA